MNLEYFNFQTISKCLFTYVLRPFANSSPCLFSDQMSEAEREALDDQQQQTGQHQVLNLKGKKMFFIYMFLQKNNKGSGIMYFRYWRQNINFKYEIGNIEGKMF